MPDDVMVSAAQIDEYRRNVADLEARAARDGLTPQQFALLTSGRATLAQIDARRAAAAPAPAAALPPGAEGKISPEVWGDFAARNPGREPTASEVLLMTEKTRMKGPGGKPTGLSATGTQRHGLV